MMNLLNASIGRLASHERILRPALPDEIRSHFFELQEKISKPHQASEIRELSLELAIELVGQEIARDIHFFWAGCQRGDKDELNASEKNALRTILDDNIPKTIEGLQAYDNRISQLYGASVSQRLNEGYQKNLPLIEASDLGISFGEGNEKQILKETSFRLESGHLSALVGPNGSGKTSLLKVLSGVVGSTSGRVSFPLIDLSLPITHSKLQGLFGLGLPVVPNWAIRKRAIFVLDQPPTVPTSGLRSTLAEYAARAGFNSDQRQIAISLIVNRYQLHQLLNRRWHDLSSGEKVRFTLACGSILRPSVLMLDEPLAPLDEITKGNFISDLRKIATRKIRPTSVLFSTHNIVEAERFTDDVLVIQDQKAQHLSTALERFNGSLFRIAPKNADTTDVPALPVEYVSYLKFGWLFVRGPVSATTATAAELLTSIGYSFSSIEDLSQSATRLQFEEVLGSVE